MPHPTRRTLAGGAALAALGVTAGTAALVADPALPPPSHPDARLLTICAEAERANALSDAAERLIETMGKDDPRLSAAIDDSDRHTDAFCAASREAAALPARDRRRHAREGVGRAS